MWVNNVSDASNPSLQATPADTNWRRDVLYFTKSCSNYRGLEGGNGNSGNGKKVINFFVLPLLMDKHLLVSKATPRWGAGDALNLVTYVIKSWLMTLFYAIKPHIHTIRQSKSQILPIRRYNQWLTFILSIIQIDLHLYK